MAWVNDYAITEGTVAAAATGDCDMPVHQANDMIIVLAAKAATGALTMTGSGFTALSSGANTTSWVGAWYKRATTSTESPPSFTLTSAVYNIIVVSVRGAHTSTAPTSAITTIDSDVIGGGALIDQTLDSTVNGLMLFGAASDAGIGIEPMPGYGQVLYAGDVGTAGLGVWWQYFKSAVSTATYRCFGAAVSPIRAVKVLVPDDGNNTYEPGRVDQTSTDHTLYAGPLGGTTLVAPDTTWTLATTNSIFMLGNDWDKAWHFDGTTTYTDVTAALNEDGYSITARNVLASSSSTDATSYAMASTVYRTGCLYLLSIENSHATSATAVSSITGGGPTFTSRSTTNFNGTLNRTSIWSAVPTADFTGVLTISFGATTQTGCVWSLNEFRNVDTTTNDGIIQQVVGTGSSTTPLATLAAFSSTDNATFAAHGVGSTSTGTAGTNFTELSDTNAATPAQALQTDWFVGNDTTADETITSAQWGSCAVELNSNAGEVAITNAVGAIVYFGSLTTFNSACFDISRAGTSGGTPTGVWEYWNGAWTTLTVVVRPNVASWTALWQVTGQGHITFTPPTDWATTAINSEGTSYYYIRRRVTATWTTNAPILDQSLKDGRSLLRGASTGLADSGLNPYHLSYQAIPVAGTANNLLQHTGGEFVASVSLNDSLRTLGIPDWSSGYLLTSLLLQLPRDFIDLGFYDLHKGTAITLMNPGITPRHILANSSSTDATSYTTASAVMKAGKLYLMSVENSHGTSATAVSAITATGGGAPTFTSRSTTLFNTNLNRVSVWSCVPGADYTGTLDIAFGGTTQTGAVWSLSEFNNVDTTTSDGMVQQTVATGNSAQPLTTLAAYGSAYNASFYTVGVGAANAGAPLAGYTELSDTTAATPAQAMHTGFQNLTQDRTPGDTITSAQWGVCGLEIKTIFTTDNPRKTWICGAKDAADQNSAKRKVIAIQPTQTINTAWAKHGALSAQGVDTFLGTASAPFGATVCAWSLLIKSGNQILAGGTSASPLTFQQAAAALVNGTNLFPIWDVNGDVADIWHPTQFGGGDDLHIICDLKGFQFPTRASSSSQTTQWHVDDDQVGFDFNGQSGDTIKFTSCLFTGGTPYYWRFNASASASATWDFSGSTIVGATVTLRSVYTFTTLIFNNCSEIVLNGADITSSTIRDTRATTNQGAVAITSAAEGDGLTNLTFINNHDGDIGHSIRISATGTYTFSNHQFSGGGVAKRSFNTGTGVVSGTDIVTVDAIHGYASGDAIYYQDQGGSVTMGLTDGTMYYINAQTTTSLSFHTTKAFAIAGTPKVDLTSTGSETHYIYSAKADVYNASGGAITINVSNGGDVPTIRESNGSSTIVNNSVNLTVTVIDASTNPVPTAQVAIFRTSDDVELMNEDTQTVTTGAFVIGVKYTIVNVGDTDFTLIGAASNTVGVAFTSTGVGGGTTGTASNGVATQSFNYTVSTPIYVRIRKSSTGETKYIPVSTTGTITSTGYSLTVTLPSDTIA